MLTNDYDTVDFVTDVERCVNTVDFVTDIDRRF
jgi:hypothetical protein